jgi:hypothetical protein
VATLKVSINKIDFNANTQARNATKDRAIEEYREKIENGIDLGPLDLFTLDETKYFIGDGFHRLLAHIEAGLSFVMAKIHKGDMRAAQLFACAANQAHGVRRTDADKRRAARILIKDEEWGKKSVREIAAYAGVSKSLVQDMKAPRGKRKGSGRVLNKVREHKVSVADSKKPGKNGKVGLKVSFTDTRESDSDEISLEELAQPYKQLCNALTATKSEIKRLSETDFYSGHLLQVVTRLTTGLDEIRATVRQITPVDWCEGCAGDGCKKCLQTGFTTKSFQSGRSA